METHVRKTTKTRDNHFVSPFHKLKSAQTSRSHNSNHLRHRTKGNMLFRLALIVAYACFTSSALASASEYEYGFEEVSDIGHWLEVKAAMESTEMRSLRGSNQTLDTMHYLHERDGEFNDEFDELWVSSEGDEFDDDLYSGEDDVEWNSNVTLIDEEDESVGVRRLAMTKRDRNWLASHNIRRKKYHTKYNKRYVPLRWSPKLKRSSKKWAKHLANLCGRRGIYHDQKNPYGENLASNWGTGSWGNRPSTESVLTRLVENEENLPYPKNGHFTQVLWRATTKVGCAEHTKVFRDGSRQKCHVQVCRYARPGNCNMGMYSDYKEPMLKDTSPCGTSIVF